MLMRILVVEDERDLNRVISKRLESEGYSIRFFVKDEGIGIAEYDLKKYGTDFIRLTRRAATATAVWVSGLPW